MDNNYDFNRTDKCEMRLELTLAVSKLRNYDVVGKSDPFCVVYVNNSSEHRSHLLHYTSLQLRPNAANAPPRNQRANSVGAASSSNAAVPGAAAGPNSGFGYRPGANGMRLPGQAMLPQTYTGQLAHQISTKVDKLSAPLPALPVPGTRPKLPPRKHPWEQIGSTEVVKNTLECSFAKPIRCTYFFEKPQQLAIDVYDEDARSRDLRAHDYLGTAVFTVASLVRAPGKCLKLPLRMEMAPRRECGFITIVAEDKALRRHLVTMDLAIEFPKNPFTLKSVFKPFAPILVIQKRASAAHDDWIIVYKSRKPARRENFVHSSNNNNASADANQNGDPASTNAKDAKYVYGFAPIRVSHERLGGDEAELKVSLVTFGYREKEYATGYCTLGQWREERQVELKSGKKRKAWLKMRTYSKVKESQFIDYVMGGCEMNIVVGIDFTASNGDPYQPSSYHFNNQYQANEYESAIRAVSEIIMEYDSRKEMLAFGFGARLPPNYDKVCHCFSLTGNQNPVCYDIDSLLDAYRQTLVQVNLSGPTEFSSLIEFAARSAQYQEQKNPQAYTILLIVTDGVINDFDETIRAIVNASKLPLSIVIIGVGEADFTAMKALDGDDIPIALGSARDIVQFVPYRNFRHSPDRLTSEVLDEIPNQLVTYYSQKGIPPNKANSNNNRPTNINNAHNNNNAAQNTSGGALNFSDLPFSQEAPPGHPAPPRPRQNFPQMNNNNTHPNNNNYNRYAGHASASQDYLPNANVNYNNMHAPPPPPHAGATTTYAYGAHEGYQNNNNRNNQHHHTYNNNNNNASNNYYNDEGAGYGYGPDVVQHDDNNNWRYELDDRIHGQPGAQSQHSAPPHGAPMQEEEIIMQAQPAVGDTNNNTSIGRTEGEGEGKFNMRGERKNSDHNKERG